MGYFGQSLSAALERSSDQVNMLVDGILSEGSTTMFFAGDGVGKSMLTLQMALEASAGLPVFGHYEVERPLRVVYIQAERHENEGLSRIKTMIQKTKANLDNLYFEPHLQGYDILLDKNRHALIEKILRIPDHFGQVDWIHIDPIYAWLSKSMATDEGAGCINGVLRAVQGISKAVSYNHHSNRGVKNEKGERAGEDLYGSRFMSANCTGVFHITSTANGTRFSVKKDSYSCLNKHVDLHYDSMYQLSYVDTESAFMSKSDRMNAFIDICKAKDKVFSIKDLEDNSLVCTRYARAHISAQVKAGKIEVANSHNSNGKRHLYRAL